MDILSVILSGRADSLGVTRAVDTAVWEGRLMQGLGLSYDFSPLLLDDCTAADRQYYLNICLGWKQTVNPNGSHMPKHLLDDLIPVHMTLLLGG